MLGLLVAFAIVLFAFARSIGADTQAAIQKFERERKMPVTGQMSDRLVKELTIVTGHPIE